MKIVAVAHDPGGANVVAATVLALRQKAVDVKVFAKGPATAQFLRLCVPFSEVPSPHGKIFPELECDLLLSGVSNEDTFERDATLWARERGVPSISIMDYWLNYAGRFKREGVTVLPDIIIAIDKICRSEMLDEGLPDERIRVLGQPYFGWLAAHTEVREVASDGRGEVLFASQNNPWEDELLGRLFRALEGCVDFKVLRIRMHPRFPDWMSVRETIDKAPVAVEFDTMPDQLESIRRHGLVLGTKSVLLIEAAMLGVPTGSIVWEEEDPLKTNELGLTVALRNSADLKGFLEQPAVGENRDLFALRHTDAAQRVAGLCLEMGKNRGQKI